jgi:hypothetical protein
MQACVNRCILPTVLLLSLSSVVCRLSPLPMHLIDLHAQNDAATVHMAFPASHQPTPIYCVSVACRYPHSRH